MDISQPCGFQHVVSVSHNDFKKYFSLQTFVSSNSPDNVNPKCVQNNMKNTQQNRVFSANTKYSTPTPIQQMPLQPDQQTLPLPLLPSDSSNSPMSTSSSNSSTTSSTSGDYMQRRKKSPAPPPPVSRPPPPPPPPMDHFWHRSLLCRPGPSRASNNTNSPQLPLSNLPNLPLSLPQFKSHHFLLVSPPAFKHPKPLKLSQVWE